MTFFSKKSSQYPDRQALVRVGESVRSRLDVHPNMHKLPTEGAEIYAMGGFLNPGECFRMIAMIDAVAQPSTLFGSANDPDYRTSYSGNLDPTDSVVKMVERRIDDLLGMEPAWGETIQGQRYMPGQQYKQHHDWFHTGSEYWKSERKRGGQRSWTAMMFLNDVEEGGQTHFTKTGVEVTPQTGAILIWNNATPSGEPNDLTLHAATPVVKGVKHVITKWYRTRKWG
jgi:prolyl 4-hydroxylase